MLQVASRKSYSENRRWRQNLPTVIDQPIDLTKRKIRQLHQPSTVAGFREGTPASIMVATDPEIPGFISCPYCTMYHEAAIAPLATGVVSFQAILNAVVLGEQVLRVEILSDRRNPRIVRARHLCFYLATILTDRSLSQIGRWFKRDHTSIISARDKVVERLSDPVLGPALSSKIALYQERLRNGAGNVGIAVDDNS